MADDAAPQAEAPEPTAEPNADAADEPARDIPQPRPTAWVTGGGALRYARAAATPNADDDDADECEGGLDDDAATEDSDTDSDGDEAAWAAADGLDGDHRALRVQGLAWDGIPQNRRRRVWLELSGARARAGDPTVPPDELRRTTEELESIVGSRVAADVKLDCGRGGGRTNSRERMVLRRVLLAVAAKFPETGYAQGLNVVAQTLLESVGCEESIIFWLLAEIIDGRLKGWWAGDFSVSLGSIASALGKWSALNGEDECLPSLPPRGLSAYSGSTRGGRRQKLSDGPASTPYCVQMRAACRPSSA